MPYLVESEQGSLKGKRVLDIACNAGFWSIQCALLGAEVIGFDARPELVEQADLIKTTVGLDNVDFRVLNFWDMSPRTLGGTFDIVLNLGILYHLPDPLQALALTKSMAERHIVLDTSVDSSHEPLLRLAWESPDDILKASTAGIVAWPTKSAVELMLRHIGAGEWFEIPVRTTDMPPDYLDGTRASWLIKP
jgi:SAM-dependent methyltransferase